MEKLRKRVLATILVASTFAGGAIGAAQSDFHEPIGPSFWNRG